MVGFETLSYGRIERRLVEPAMLTMAERAWLDAYHGRVLDVLGPELNAEERTWLLAKCATIGG